MAYSDPYETWKQQGRPGGDFGAWQGAQGVQQAAPQLQQQPYNPPAPQPQLQPAPQAAQPAGGDWFNQFSANSDWRDTNVSDPQWQAWQQEQNAKGGAKAGCPPNLPFTSRPGADGQTSCAAKPDDCPEGQHVVGSDTNGTAHCVGGGAGGDFAGGGGGGAGGGGGGGGGAGGIPQFTAPKFTPPGYDEAMNDPGYQFALKEGQTGLQHSQAAQGLLRTGGSLADLLKYNQGMAAQQYQNVYNRAANTFGLNYQGAKDEFAPQFAGWQTQYGGDLSKWTTNQNTGLQKYLQQQQNIYGLVNQPMMPFPSWS